MLVLSWFDGVNTLAELLDLADKDVIEARNVVRDYVDSHCLAQILKQLLTFRIRTNDPVLFSGSLNN